MNILVTGGTGFLGSHLCKKLCELGNNVFCLDNNYTGKVSNINNLLNKPNFHYIHHDIINPIILNINIDQIFHLACPASPPKYQKDPIYTAKTCFIGSLNVLEFARRKNAVCLLSSTSEIYGEPEISPQVETYRGNVNTLGIRSCYDEGKRIAETLFMDFNRFYDVETRIIRIFNTYGPYMDKSDGRVITNFINQALRGKNITIYGSGAQTRSFCYVTDLIDGMMKCMNSKYVKPINLGNPNELSIVKLAQKILGLIKSESRIIYKDLPEDDPTHRKPNIHLAKVLLDWEPTIDLTEGLKKTINYFIETYHE